MTEEFNEEIQPQVAADTSAARVASLEAEVKSLRGKLDTLIVELDAKLSRVGKPVDVRYSFQKPSDVITG